MAIQRTAKYYKRDLIFIFFSSSALEA